MNIKGIVKSDKKTKNLVKKIKGGEIALISHSDLDEVAALSLVEAKVRAVVNTRESISGKYPNLGPEILLNASIPLIDCLDNDLMNQLSDEDFIEIVDNKLYKNNNVISTGVLVTREYIDQMICKAKDNLEKELEDFIDNTLEYAKKEQKFIIQGLDIPNIDVNLLNRHVLVVVRGKNYKEDLLAIKSYIKEMRPILIGVDGGGDALLDFGLVPDLVIGDMDSVSDKCLCQCREIIVHGYMNGKAPGLTRIEELDLNAKVIYAPGTSEDIALLMAHQLGAELIVAVGSHSNMIDFLEKGRKGMASTFLARLKIGSILIDAKGVSQLYSNHIKPRYIVGLLISALLPLGIVLALSTPLQQLFRLFHIRIRLMMGL